MSKDWNKVRFINANEDVMYTENDGIQIRLISEDTIMFKNFSKEEVLKLRDWLNKLEL